MARRKYVEKVRFYAFLDTLTQLADNCSTEPYYFKEYASIDALLVVTRINEPFKFVFKFYEKPLVCRNSFSSTRLMYQLETDESTFQMVLFDAQVVYIQDFINFLKSVETNGELKKLFDDLLEMDIDSNNQFI